MNIPEELRTALAAADDAYLTGLSNKGTLNRAKKDLAGLTPTAEAAGKMAVVTMGTETVMVTVPLGSSMCSCPSASMCRHRIGAMLWLRDQAGEAEPPKPEFAELKAYPAEKLVKVLGQKRTSAVLFRHRSGSRPYLDEGTTIRVEMPWHPAVVRLLEPLEHSTCSCHSRELCRHKAEALLWWQLDKGIVKPEALEPEPEDGPDPERVRGVCAALRQMLSEQLVTGLSRMPDSVRDTTERMAALSHTSGIPALERALRNLHGEYAAYFAHSATFRESALLDRLGRAWRLASTLEQADDRSLGRLVGTFRDAYTQTADLKLYLLGMREYVGRSGYGGMVYYFFERNTHEIYTFRDLRPEYYENKRKRQDAAPWGMPCTLRKAYLCAMDLHAPQVNAAGNLSSTKDCEAVFLGSAKPWLVVPNSCLVTDFEKLLDRSDPELSERERLVLIRPARWECRPFDPVSQTWSMELFDDQGRDILAEVRYEQKEEAVVLTLENLERQLAQGAEGLVFFGICHRDGDRIKLYPIEYFLDWRDGP